MGAHIFRSPLFHFIARHLALLLVLSFVAIPLAAQTPPASSAPRVVVVFNLRSNELQLIDHKYRVFYNKFEKKNLPIEGYDLRGAIQDEVMNTLVTDSRYQWRVATEADKLDAAQLAEEKTRTPEMLSNAQADRVLVVDVNAIGGMITGLGKDQMWIGMVVTMLDRASGRKLWKKGVGDTIPFSGDLQKLQSENQKELKEGINTLIEKTCVKLKAKVAESKI
ncbi:MAG: hypothetical protein LAN70_17985 [Acidobacteriia bacterium]|nr:hypothetical protein [Terriglobia bacterium]